MDTLMLSRIQFAANITFHILFPTISISLGWVLLYFKLRHASKAPDNRWQQAYQFWVKIFALCFAVGCGQRYYHVFPIRHQLARLYDDGG